MSGEEIMNCQCDFSEKHDCQCKWSEIENIIECFNYEDCKCPCHQRHEFSEDGHSEEDEYW